MGFRGAVAVVSALTAALLVAPAAQALSAPEVFLKEVDESNQPIGNWVPLAGAATMHSVNRYEIGVRIQDDGNAVSTQRALLQVTSVPQGPPNQPDIYSTFCNRVSGSSGQIADTGVDLRYQGDGPYTLSVTVTPNDPNSVVTGCTAGPTTNASFTASAATSVRFLGRMVITNPNLHPAFAGLQIVPALGAGGTEIRCARDPRPAADGSLTGSLVINQAGDGAQKSPSTISAGAMLPRPGSWACVGRSVGGGIVPGPWSAPTATEDVQTGFYPKSGSWRLSNTRGPVYKLAGSFIPALAAGGRLTVAIQRGGKHAKPVRLNARVGAGGHVSLRFRLPPISAAGPVAGFRIMFSFAGTRFAAARAQFYGFALIATPTVGGRAQVQFGSPCPPQRC